MKFSEIQQLPRAYYEVDVGWDDLENTLKRFMERTGGIAPLNLNPDYQRAHVWTRVQQLRYVEYMLVGGEVGRNITFNCPGWMSNFKGPFELVDGKQRIEAVRAFMRDELAVFTGLNGYYYDKNYPRGLRCSEFEGRMGHHVGLKFRVCEVATRVEVLELYLNINAGGTPHTEEELDRVRELLIKEREKSG
jgi:hypothetical protein